MRAEEMFKEYVTLKKELMVLQFQLENFKGVDESDIIHSMTLAHPEGERVQTSGISDKTAKVALNFRQIMERENDDWFSFLWNRYRYINEEVEFFERCVASLSDILSGVITDLLDEDMTWDAIAMKYHVSTTMVSKYKKSALKKLEEMYELRDIQTEKYIFS